MDKGKNKANEVIEVHEGKNVPHFD